MKFPDQTLTQIRKHALALGYTQNYLIVQLVESALFLVNARGQESLPKIVMLARAAQDYEEAPPVLQSRPKSRARMKSTTIGK